MVRYGIIVTGLVLIAIITYGVIVTDFATFSIAYRLPLLWLVLLPILIYNNSITRKTVLLTLHTLVIALAIYAVFLYNIFLHISDNTPLINTNHTAINNLIFDSENYLYMALYSGLLLLLADLYWFLKGREKLK